MSLENMKKRLLYAGGGQPTQDDRNVNGKLKSFYSALQNSYQAEWIHLDKDNSKHRCLINASRLQPDYDQKIISIDFNSNIKCGDTFFWDRTNSHWIVFLQAHAEEAYFRAYIRKCDYQIDDYWVYVRGSNESSLDWIQKHGLEINKMNYSLFIYIQKNPETQEKFKRHSIIKFEGHNWKVAAVDRYSQEGILEVYLEEYFDNSFEQKDNTPETPPPAHSPYIKGEKIVYPYDKNLVYSIVNADGGVFEIDSKKVRIVKQTENSCVLDVITGKSGSFVLKYKRENKPDITLDIIIKSL